MTYCKHDCSISRKLRKTWLFGFLMIGILSSCCGGKITTTTNDSYLPEFHQQCSSKSIDLLEADNLQLFVDYSTCNVLGQHSSFYQALVPSLTSATKAFYSIKGNDIAKEEGSTFELLRTISEVNYADLKGAVDQMAQLPSESVLLTDGEYFQQSLAKGNINNPYMADAFKKWLLRGHDIYFFSEPYQEPYNGVAYNKKRFYIIFTDNRLKGNIYDRIVQTVELEKFPTVEMFHLSADHPSLMVEKGNTTTPNENLSANMKGFGDFEVQDWPVTWEVIESIIVNAMDANTGELMEYGEPFTKGLKLDRNSFGGFRITDVKANVYDINQAYSDFADSKDAGQKVAATGEMPVAYPNFITIDEKEFKSHGVINLHFDTPMYDPTILTGSPMNYFRIDICISEVQNTFSQHASMFEFDSIDLPGNKNVSVEESVKQCLADPDVQEKLHNTPIYSIYVKSPKR